MPIGAWIARCNARALPWAHGGRHGCAAVRRQGNTAPDAIRFSQWDQRISIDISCRSLIPQRKICGFQGPSTLGGSGTAPWPYTMRGRRVLFKPSADIFTAPRQGNRAKHAAKPRGVAARSDEKFLLLFSKRSACFLCYQSRRASKRKASSSFLKKRTKKLSFVWNFTIAHNQNPVRPSALHACPR